MGKTTTRVAQGGTSKRNLSGTAWKDDNQIRNLLGMLIELKEKLENAVEKKIVEKGFTGSDKGLAKEVVPEQKTEPFRTRQSDEHARGSQNMEGKAMASKAEV
ncbi:hypothetical protein AAC387_Pa02g1872 [Persea americana]